MYIHTYMYVCTQYLHVSTTTAVQRLYFIYKKLWYTCTKVPTRYAHINTCVRYA